MPEAGELDARDVIGSQVGRAPRDAGFSRRIRDAVVYRPLAFAEPAESIELAQMALAVPAGGSVAGITSSGDILLALLADGAGRVRGFDANPVQTALARLKLALCGRVPAERATEFLGLAAATRDERMAQWAELRAAMGDDAEILERFDVGGGVVNSGTTRKLFRWMSTAMRACIGRAATERLVGAGSTEADRLRLLEELRGRALYRWLLRPVLSGGGRLFQHFLYPPALCANSDHPRRALRDILLSYRRLFEVGFHDNPVLGRHLTGEIPREQLRRLYSNEPWAEVRRRAGDIRFETAVIQKGLMSLERGSVDAIYLSNAPDYLRPDGLRELAAAVRHAARPGARVYYLSLDDECVFERSRIDVAFRRAREIESRLTAADPVGLYRFLGVGICD